MFESKFQRVLFNTDAGQKLQAGDCVMNPLNSSSDFRIVFAQGLETLILESAKPQGALGTLVLATMNVVHHDLRKQFGPKLTGVFETLIQPQRLLALVSRSSDEDLIVFLRIAAGQLASLPATQYEKMKRFTKQFNKARAYRPRRSAGVPFTQLLIPFRATEFNFNWPNVSRELFWSTSDASSPELAFFYNKFPFANLHTLLVPDKALEQPQYLTEPAHRWAWNMVNNCAIDGLGFGYNSLGAYASVNHLHFQMFIEPEGLPVMSCIWRHNGGADEYPLPCVTAENDRDAWNWIQGQHTRNQPYNLIYTPEKIYCFSRKPQLTYEHASWTSGFAWFEVAGHVITNSLADYERVTDRDIEQELAKLAE
jgi:hypothetical protein